jgi:hypothetical protein
MLTLFVKTKDLMKDHIALSLDFAISSWFPKRPVACMILESILFYEQETLHGLFELPEPITSRT